MTRGDRKYLEERKCERSVVENDRCRAEISRGIRHRSRGSDIFIQTHESFLCLASCLAERRIENGEEGKKETTIKRIIDDVIDAKRSAVSRTTSTILQRETLAKEKMWESVECSARMENGFFVAPEITLRID